MHLEYLVFVGAAVRLWGGWSYTRDTFMGRVQPNLATWSLWSLTGGIAMIGGIVKEVGLAIVPVIAAWAITPTIIIASIKNHHTHWQLGRFDYGCALLSLVAIVAWIVTNEPNMAIGFSILGNILAWLPTAKKSITHPQTESMAVYAAGLFAPLTVFTAINSWSFAALAFPLWLIFSNAFLLIAVLWPR